MVDFHGVQEAQASSSPRATHVCQKSSFGGSPSIFPDSASRRGYHFGGSPSIFPESANRRGYFVEIVAEPPLGFTTSIPLVTARDRFWVYGLSAGLATLLVVIAISAPVLQLRINISWSFIAIAAISAAVGLKANEVMRGNQSHILNLESEKDLLLAQLEQQRSAVDSLADGLDVAIFICDTRANILYANRRAITLFRFAQPAGKSILAVTLSYDLEQLVLAASRTGENKSAELIFPYPEERVGIAESWTAPDNKDRAFLSVYEITELRRLERIRQDFVANVSHELRTPLTLIRAMSETLLDDEAAKSELQERYLGKIITEVDRLSMISQDLLILSAAESNPVRKQTCDIAEVFSGVVQQLESKASAKGLVLEFVSPSSVLVDANASQMTQVALNLIDNAINYTAHGAVNVEIVANSDPVTIRVKDSGIGISSEHQTRVFERFYRVDKGRSRATGGTGLGLSIVKHIVEAHGGRVSVSSTLNEGSTFTVELARSIPDRASA